jgi:HemY protein
MIRVVLYLVLIGLIAAGAAWLADRPGDVTITWLGLHIETSVLVAAAAVAIIAALTVFLWSLVRLLLRSPRLLASFRANRRRATAQRAIARGLIAIGAGDTTAAQRFAAQAGKLAPGEPLALLLTAQMAQATGDRAGAERAFRAMAERQDTRLIGMRGLYVEAQRRNDTDTARHYAEAVAHAAPALSWASHAVLKDRCAVHDWAGAITALDRMQRAGVIDRASHRRQRAVLLTALAEAEPDAAKAKAHALEAVKLAPDLVPAAALAGKLAAEAGERRKAARIVEAAWRAEPHPDLAEVYAHLRSGDSARDRLARVQILQRLAPRHVESALAVARAAIDAHDFATARAALGPLSVAPTQRVALLMAELEEAEHGDVGRARAWMSRALRAARDPAWTADGIVSDHWLPVSPVTGELDAFRWRAPVSEIAAPAIDQRQAIEERHVVQEPVPQRIEAAPPLSGPPGGGTAPGEAAAVEAAAEAEEAPPEPAPRPAPAATAAAAPANPAVPANPAAPASAPPARRPDAVIPLVHAPDDPGPPAPKDRSWRSLFR